MRSVRGGAAGVIPPHRLHIIAKQPCVLFLVSGRACAPCLGSAPTSFIFERLAAEAGGRHARRLPELADEVLAVRIAAHLCDALHALGRGEKELLRCSKLCAAAVKRLFAGGEESPSSP